jgi:hypothetical protein
MAAITVSETPSTAARRTDALSRTTPKVLVMAAAYRAGGLDASGAAARKRQRQPDPFGPSRKPRGMHWRPICAFERAAFADAIMLTPLCVVRLWNDRRGFSGLPESRCNLLAIRI